MFDHKHPIHGQLLQLILEHRFITTKQLVRLTTHQYGSTRSATRQTLRHLNSLRERHCVVRLERRVGGWQGGSTTAIWTLTTKGHRLVTGSRKRLRPHHYSTTFLEHTLAVTETRILLSETTHQDAILQVEATGEPDSWRKHLGPHGEPLTLKPDLAVTVTSDEFVDRYFIEVDRATENPARVIRKCWQYEQHRRSGTEQRHNEIYPAVIWLVPHAKRQQQILLAIQAESQLTEKLFIVITPDQLQSLIQHGPA